MVATAGINTTTWWTQEIKPYKDGLNTASWRSAWRLLANHFTPAKMPPVIIFPRPDSETESWARHRKTYTGALYEFKVGVTGGAYPYYFELTTSPTGMTIGETYGDADYGEVTWTNPTAGPHSVTIKVTDQDLTEVTVDYDLVVSTTGFVFLDSVSGNDSTGDGSIGSPYATIAAVHLDTVDDTTFSGYQILFRTGTYPLTGQTDRTLGSTTLGLKLNYFPAVWLPYNGEVVTLDYATCKVYVGAQADIFIGEFTHKDADTNWITPHFWKVFGNTPQDRLTFYNPTFTNIEDQNASGTLGGAGDNQSCIQMEIQAVSQQREYFYLSGVTISDYDAPVTDFYGVDYWVTENITAGASKYATTHSIIFPKLDDSHGTIRHVESLTADCTAGPINCYLGAGNNPSQYIEVCYNNVKEPNYLSDYVAFRGPAAGQYSANVDFDVWVYRNTINGRTYGGNWIEHTETFEQNVVVNEETNIIHPSNNLMTVTLGTGDRANLTGDAADTIIDANGVLQGTYSTNYLGIRGHVIE